MWAESHPAGGRKKRMNKRLINGFTLVVLTAASALAGQPITAQIPFSFHVGDSMFPSGSYMADLNVAQGVLRVRSTDHKSAAMVLSHGVQSSATTQKPKLVFKKYGDAYFLYQVWTAGNNTGQELHPSRLEREFAKASQGSQTILVAADR
jgi:hypothetical protein